MSRSGITIIACRIVGNNAQLRLGKSAYEGDHRRAWHFTADRMQAQLHYHAHSRAFKLHVHRIMQASLSYGQAHHLLLFTVMVENKHKQSIITPTVSRWFACYLQLHRSHKMILNQRKLFVFFTKTKCTNWFGLSKQHYSITHDTMSSGSKNKHVI